MVVAKGVVARAAEVWEAVKAVEAREVVAMAEEMVVRASRVEERRVAALSRATPYMQHTTGPPDAT